MKVGKVFLVGAGPGDPKLITLKALEALEEADVVVYDRLIPTDILKKAKKAELIYVGKTKNSHTIPQENINEILLKETKEGKRVVRLKGGDPYIFGRGGEELIYLREREIEVEYIPGVTSAIAVPGSYNIPLTHRGFSSSLAIVTGHGSTTKDSTIRWAELSKAVDTLVILMGVGRIEDIVNEIRMDEETTVGIIEKGYSKDQRIVTCKLKDLVETVKKKEIKPPSIFVFGDVVKIFEMLREGHDNKG